jgi:hypothetical protein
MTLALIIAAQISMTFVGPRPTPEEALAVLQRDQLASNVTGADFSTLVAEAPTAVTASDSLPVAASLDRSVNDTGLSWPGFYPSRVVRFPRAARRSGSSGSIMSLPSRFQPRSAPLGRR